MLGGALYFALARQLVDASTRQLQERADLVVSSLTARGPSPFPHRGPFDVGVAPEPGSPGIVLRGALSGTIAAVVLPGAEASANTVYDPAGVDAARAGQTTINDIEFDGTALRALSEPVVDFGQTYVIQIVGDRTNELRTLQVTVIVLMVGGLLVVLAAAALGWIYAGRALVPIRNSLRRQREFAADASHELRTPLTVIRGNLRLLRSTSTRPETRAAALDDIDGEVDRMTSLVEQLLLLARTDSDAIELELGPTDLADEAADTLEAFTPVAEAKQVQLGLDVEPAPLTADQFRVRQLIGILVDNAVRHAPQQGHVNVKVREAGGRATLTVEDDGPGIRPQDLPRVFDRFWRAADAPEGGSGLGLSIAAWIVERHGGRIRAENRQSGGARFTADLPVT